MFVAHDGDLERHLLGDLEAVALEADDLARVVRQEPDRVQAQVAQDLRADAVVAQVRREAERLVGLDGVAPCSCSS